MNVVWSSVAWRDFTELASPETQQRITMIITEIRGTEGKGIGNPTKLRGQFKGWISRRIDRSNRLIYRINGNRLEIAMCLYHS